MKRLALSESAVETITDLRKITLKMFFGYFPVRAGKYRFCVGNDSMCPWQ
jgi:hypothetical protein